MLETGLELRPPELTRRIEGFQCSAFEIPKPDNFVEHVFCMRLLHHIGNHEDRLRILREFARVASDTVAVSLWTDGNFKAMRRRQNEARRKEHRYQNRFLIPRETIEAEFDEAGLDIIGRVNFLRFYSMWVVSISGERSCI
jgi:ubiquinone/menaquinone biosynthesis C-methylase UbiE